MTNNDLRRRTKLKQEQNNGRQAPNPNRKRKEAKPSGLYKPFACLLLSGTILTVFILLYIDNIPWYLGHRAIDIVAKKFGHNKLQHAVILDAGSTGSRVLAYTFHESYIGGNLFLDKELFKHTKPGLSSFADNPEKGVATLAHLLEEAKREIPKEYWSSTPLVLKATAGLRLLPQEKADNLLNSVREFLEKSPFKTNKNSVEIMDGTDEGIFSWFTVNFLLDRIHGNPTKTVAALDLGGGSTQVTFSALTPSSLSQREFIHEAVSPNGPIPVYTHSYLGLGLMAARKEIVTLNQPDQVNVTSECVNHIVRGRKFHFGNTDYYVSGPSSGYPTSQETSGVGEMKIKQNVPIVNFQKCEQLVTDYVVGKSQPPDELSTKMIFAFSYYFDRATEVGLIDEGTGGQIKVEDFRQAAKQSCHEANEEQPFMCLDLTFISVLLEKGFGLHGQTKVFLYKKINGHEISWALGAAYDVLNS